MRVRGTVERIDGSTLYVKARDGVGLKINLSEKPVFTAIVPGIGRGMAARSRP